MVSILKLPVIFFIQCLLNSLQFILFESFSFTQKVIVEKSGENFQNVLFPLNWNSHLKNVSQIQISEKQK